MTLATPRPSAALQPLSDQFERVCQANPDAYLVPTWRLFSVHRHSVQAVQNQNPLNQA
jgi:hypothetical protein